VHYVNPTSNLQPAAFRFLPDASGQSPFTEAEEMELAMELLEVTSEAELEQFLGNLLEKAWAGIKPVASGISRPLGGVLKTVVKTALPFTATVADTHFGPAGGAIAERLGSLVREALEAETSTTASADRDLERCRQFVRMAGKAASVAALAPTGASPIALAQQVLATSAREKLAKQPAAASKPGTGATSAAAASPVSIPVKTAQTGWRKGERGTAVVNGRPCSSCGQPPASCKCGTISQTGRWIRHGQSIVIINC
jgi:hypothetical protein